MTADRKRAALAWSLFATFGGGALSFLALMVFFGGSDRDPPWAWALYLTCLFGGGIVSLVGIVCLFVVLVQRAEE